MDCVLSAKMDTFFKQGSQLVLCRAEIAHLVSSLTCCLFETFRWDLKWDVLFETFGPFETFLKPFETWNSSDPEPNELQVQIRKVSNIWNFKYPVRIHHFQKFQISLKYLKVILGHVITVSINQNTGNSQILWEIMRLSQNIFPFKEQCCLQQLC